MSPADWDNLEIDHLMAGAIQCGYQVVVDEDRGHRTVCLKSPMVGDGFYRNGGMRGYVAQWVYDGEGFVSPLRICIKMAALDDGTIAKFFGLKWSPRSLVMT